MPRLDCSLYVTVENASTDYKRHACVHVSITPVVCATPFGLPVEPVTMITQTIASACAPQYTALNIIITRNTAETHATAQAEQPLTACIQEEENVFRIHGDSRAVAALLGLSQHNT